MRNGWIFLLALLQLDGLLGAEWRLTFSDEFSGTALNTSIWTVADNYTHTSTELQLYVESAVCVADGGERRLASSSKHI